MCSRFILCFSFLVFLSCSIKENREECPCVLKLNFKDGRNECLREVEDGYYVSWAVSDIVGSVVDSGSFVCDTLPDSYALNVPGRVLNVVLFVMEREAVESDDSPGIFTENDRSWRIKEGSDCPPVFSFAREIDCRSGMNDLMVSCNRDFAMLYCVMEGNSSSWSGTRYELSGNVCGFAADLSPCGGNFHCSLNFDLSKGVRQIAVAGIPRQVDGSLKLDVISSENELIRSFALGEYIISGGYDWEDALLDDIVVELNMAETDIEIEVNSDRNAVHLYYEISSAGEKCYICND